MSGDHAWAATLRAACERPEVAATAWRAGGGRVVGLLGWSAPRELVIAAGMLPIRLSPDRLTRLGPLQGGGGASRADEMAERDGAGWAYGVRGPAGRDAAAAFGRELAPATAGFAAALLSGALDWIDFLLIGRDREDYTRLFYLLRELRRSGAAPGLVPVAFFDLLRTPSRTSARYNRQRAAELVTVLAGWAGRPVTQADLTGAAEAAGGTARSFRGIRELRTRPRPRITGTDALAAAIAAGVLPAAELRPLLDAALAAGAADAPGPRDPARDTGPGPAAPCSVGRKRAGRDSAHETPAPDITAIPSASPLARIFLAGSAVDDPAAYQAVEDLGLAIVGEDHEWGADGSEFPRATRDPLDGIVDRYQFAHGGAARAGLRDRVESTAGRVRADGADGVLYLIGERDEAAGWELPCLRERLGGIPLVSVRPHDQVRLDEVPGDPARADRGPGGDGDWPALLAAGRRLLAELTVAGTASAAGSAGTARGAAAGVAREARRD